MRRSCATRSTPTALAAARSIIHALGSLTAAASLMLIASCGDGPAKTRESDAMVKSSTPGGTDEADFADAAADLKAAFARKPDPAAGARTGGPTTPTPPTASRSKLEPLPKRAAPAEGQGAKVYPEPAPAALSAPMPANVDDLASRRDELVLATARTVRAWADAGGDPTLAATQHAALAAFASARTSPLPSTWLDSDQRKSADAIGGLMRDLAAQGPRALDTATAGALLSQRAGELGFNASPSSPTQGAVVQTGPSPTTSILNVPTVALCRKVESFGVYEPLASTTIQAGRQHTMIVYTEVEGFEQRASNADDHPGFSSELSQTVMLYHDADGLLAWTRPEVTVHDTTRRLRRDYYLVQRLELPPTLTIGKYNLKVMVRDKLTGAEAETTVPIHVVATASSTPSQR